MKLEFLGNISESRKYPQVVANDLLRLYDFSSDEALKLYRLIEQLLKDKQPVELCEAGFIEPVNCSLLLCICDENIDTPPVSTIGSDHNEFVCRLPVESYHKMLSFIEPFTNKESSGYQWLIGGHGEEMIHILLSPGGTW